MSRRRKDITGEYFGRLKVLFYHKTPHKAAYWLCECACGNFKVVRGSNLRSGNTTSCGCNSCIVPTHGMVNTRLYKIWDDMKYRCKSECSPDALYYKHKGITVCDEWVNSFETFYAWAMNSGYSDDLTIDRIDGTKGYSPDNCRWVTRKQQSNNISSNRILTIDGISHNVSEWAEIVGINRNTLNNRLRSGWNEKSAVFTPVDTRYSNKRK